MAEAPVVTRIAPSPTGDMHIGTARTALFNWLYARGRGGQFLLRIEDTDRARSSDEATEKILAGLRWLGLDWDGEPVSQVTRAPRHVEVAHQMLASGHAYKCFSTQAEIEDFRAKARAAGQSTLFRSPWRDTDPANHPDAPYAVRIKAPREGKTVIHDAVQGDVVIKNDQLDDMICLRSDGTPTYMLAVVVDDHDMGVTHVIRGDDHLANAARQLLIYRAMDWQEPVWAHIPLIHGPDGKKLSKRHGATSVSEYQQMGYPAAGMRNYLARLGWSHGDDEFFSDDQARDWFDLDNIGKAAARFDTKKLEHICGQHISASEDADLTAEVEALFAAIGHRALSPAQASDLTRAMYCLKSGTKNLLQLVDKARFILSERPIGYDEKAHQQLDAVSIGILNQLTPQLQDASWDRNTLEAIAASVSEANGIKFGKLAGPIRAALAGRTANPSVFDMMLVLGRDETMARLNDVQGNIAPDA